MDEPLLGSSRKSGFFSNPALLQFFESGTNRACYSPSVFRPTASSIKEWFIFGTPEPSPGSGLAWIGGDQALERRDDYLQSQLPGKTGRRLRRSLSNGENGKCDSVANSRRKARSYDDSLVDYSFSRYSVGASKCNNRTVAESDILLQDFWLNCESNRRESTEGAQEEHCSVDLTGFTDEASTKSRAMQRSKKHLRRSRTAPAMTVMDEKRSSLNLKRPPLQSSTSVVTQAFIGLMLYLSIGVVIYVWKKDDFSGSSTHGFIDAVYFCIVTMCTIGYGDITPTTPSAKLFSCAFVLVGFGFIDVLLSGMVTYVLDRQETQLLSAVSGGHHEIAEHYVVDVQKGRMRIRMKVALAFGVVTSCIGVGTIVMHSLESLAWLDAFYLSCMSVTTVGYGDHAFKTLRGRVFASIWLLVSTLAVARSFLYLTEARIDKRHRLIAKWVLQEEMTAGDLLAADLDNDGCVSKSDFVVYKLKQMGKIEEKDILEVCRQFSRLDADNYGKITISYLINHDKAQCTNK